MHCAISNQVTRLCIIKGKANYKTPEEKIIGEKRKNDPVKMARTKREAELEEQIAKQVKQSAISNQQSVSNQSAIRYSNQVATVRLSWRSRMPSRQQSTLTPHDATRRHTNPNASPVCARSVMTSRGLVLSLRAACCAEALSGRNVRLN